MKMLCEVPGLCDWMKDVQALSHSHRGHSHGGLLEKKQINTFETSSHIKLRVKRTHKRELMFEIKV